MIANLAETFWHGPYDLLHVVTHSVESAGPAVVWLTDTGLSAVFGLTLGLIIAGITFALSGLLKRSKTPVTTKKVSTPNI